MTAVGSLVFCNACGNLLPASTTSKKTTLKCDVCGTKCKDVSAKSVITQSKPADYPSALRTKHANLQTIDPDTIEQNAIAQVACEKCGNPETRFYTMQLRSADEGSTVFYNCEKCGHKWNTNN